MIKKILALLLLSSQALAGDPFIFQGNFAKNLAASGVTISNSSQKQIIDLFVDPSAGGGVAAVTGSIGFRDNAGVGELWEKVGAANTAWTKNGGGPGTANTIAGYNASGNLFSIPQWSIDSVEGYLSSNLNDTPVDGTSVNSFDERLYVNPSGNTTTANALAHNVVLTYDNPNAGFNFAGSTAVSSTKFVDNGTGNMGQVIVNDNSAGLNAGAGTVDQLIGITDTINVSTGKTVNTLDGELISMNNDAGSTVLDALGLGIGYTGDITNSFTGLQIAKTGSTNNANIFSTLNGGDSTGTTNEVSISSTGTNVNDTFINAVGSGTTSNSLTGLAMTFGSNSKQVNGISINTQGTTGGGDLNTIASNNNQDVAGNETAMILNDSGDVAGSFTGFDINKNASDVGNGATLFAAAYNGGDVTGNLTYYSANGNANSSDNLHGLDIGISGNALHFIGANIQSSGTYDQDVYGVKVDVSSATLNAGPGSKKVSGNFSGGILTNGTGPLHTISNYPFLVDSGNQFVPNFVVENGTPITGTDFIANSMPALLEFHDNYSGSAFNLGVVSVGFISQFGVDSGKTVSKVSMAAAGGSYPPSSTGGTITELNMYDAAGAINGGGSLNVTNIYGLHLDNSVGGFSGATNSYGVFADYSGFKNYLGGSTRIGGSSYVAPSVPLDVSGAIKSDTSLQLEDPGAGTNKWTIQSPTLASDYTLTLPVDDGGASECLKTDGSGVTSWGPCSGGAISLTNTHLFVGNASNVATDVAASGDLTLANTGAFTFNTVNANVGSFGTASSVAAFTVNAKGLITAAANTAIQIAESAVTNLVSDLAAKLSTTLTNGHIFVGNASNVATDVSVTGDVTISNAGVTAIGTNVVTNSQLAQMPANTIKGNNTGGTANALDLTTAQVKTMLNLSGTNSGDVTLTAVGSTPNANGASLSGQALTLQPADNTNPGVVTAGTQTFGGAKTFSSAPTFSSLGLGVLHSSSGGLVSSSTIVNADVSASAAIDFSKLAALTSAHILLGSAGNVATDTAVTGDIAITNTGVTSYSGTVPINKGGTNITSYTTGDTLYASATNVLSKLAIGSTGQVLTVAGGVPTWAAAGAATETTQSYELKNLGLSSTVGSNLLTVALKQADGSTNPASGSGAVLISFRDSTLANGQYFERSVTGSLSINTVGTGATFGTVASINQYIYVYAIDNAGTVELALAGARVFDEGTRFSTTAIGAGSTSSTTLYSTTARSNVAVRFIGRVKVNESTAGTYASAPTEVSLTPIATQSVISTSVGVTRIEYAVMAACSSDPCTINSQSGGGQWLSSINRQSAGAYTINFVSGIWAVGPVCTIGTNNGVIPQCEVGSTSSTTCTTAAPTTGVLTDNAHTAGITCVGLAK